MDFQKVFDVAVKVTPTVSALAHRVVVVAALGVIAFAAFAGENQALLGFSPTTATVIATIAGFAATALRVLSPDSK